MEDKMKLKLGDQDAAVVFRSNGTTELFIPPQDDDIPVYKASYNVGLCAILFKCPDLLALADKRMREELDLPTPEERGETPLFEGAPV